MSSNNSGNSNHSKEQNQKLKNIAIVLKPHNSDSLINLIPNLCRWLTKRKCIVTFFSKEQTRLTSIFSKSDFEKINFSQQEQVFTQADLIITLGGDGTLIGLCRKVNSNVPIFGINRGNLGFITEYGQSDFYDQLNDVIQGNFLTEEKPLFRAQINRSNKTIVDEVFFNDAVITKNDIARMFSLSVKADDDHIYDLSGDGLIISSPIGSTAYSLAAGGPIVNPQVQAMILTPISAHGLNHRPIVIDDRSVLEVTAIPPFKSVILTIDGQKAFTIEDRDQIIIKKHHKKITFVKNPERSYYRTLKEKFGHGK